MSQGKNDLNIYKVGMTNKRSRIDALFIREKKSHDLLQKKIFSLP